MSACPFIHKNKQLVVVLKANCLGKFPLSEDWFSRPWEFDKSLMEKGLKFIIKMYLNVEKESRLNYMFNIMYL